MRSPPGILSAFVKKNIFNRGVRQVLRAFTTPLIPRDYAGLLNPLIGRELRGHIDNIERHDQFTTIHITPGPGLKPDFHPGQFIGIGLQIDGRWQWRSYSLTNAPGSTLGTGSDGNGMVTGRHTLTISVKPVPGGLLSKHIAEHAKVGQLIRLTAPSGDFYLPEPLPERVVFLTAGAGITPVMSMLRWLRQGVAATAWPEVVHIHSERSAEPSQPYGAELTTLAEDHSKYHLVHWDSTSRGRIDPDDIEKIVADILHNPTSEQTIYACGPASLLEELTSHFPDVVTEEFYSPLATTNTAGGTVEFWNTGITAESTGTTTILEAGEAAHVHMLSGCRMGICRTCVVPIEEGNALDLRSGETYGEGEQIRTCCSVPVERVRIGQQK